MEDMAMNTALNLAPLWRSGIGFDGLVDLLNEAMKPVATHPPYNIEKTGEDAYRITLVVAGFKPNELSVTSEPNLLTIVGQPAGEPGGQFLYQGLQRGPFEHRFRLADYVKVTGAQLNDGLLTIDLAREVPEAMKPRRIEIAATPQGGQWQLEKPEQFEPQVEEKKAA
ncbi:MAG TPA: Hsp20 family protein [Thermomicrobiales bacterium]|nr:Hsp20 family protein [Thermomicrobiales bacterium]